MDPINNFPRKRLEFLTGFKQLFHVLERFMSRGHVVEGGTVRRSHDLVNTSIPPSPQMVESLGFDVGKRKGSWRRPRLSEDKDPVFSRLRWRSSPLS